MSDKIHTLSAAVPFRDTCGKSLTEIPGWEACADRLCEAYGLPASSIRTQSQLLAAMHDIDRVMGKVEDLNKDPVKAAAALKAIEAFNDAVGMLAQGAATLLVKTTEGREDLAGKQATRLLNGLAEGKSDASTEDWLHLTRLLEHARTQQ